MAGRAGAVPRQRRRIRLSLVSTGTLGDWDRRRFRANVVLDGAGEDALVGPRMRARRRACSTSALPIPRCVMVTRPQPGGIGRDTSVLKTIHRERDGELAVRRGRPRPRARCATGDVLEPA